MGTLYLVRHGQASFGADDYDQLSALGELQSVRLGAYFAGKNLAFDHVLCGTLRRHKQTYAGICRGLGRDIAAQPWPGLNEFDSIALIRAVHSEPLERPDTAQRYRHYFQLLRTALRAWMHGTLTPQGMPSYAEFRAGVVEALDHVRQHCDGAVLLVSSGGPIATALSHVLGTAPESTIELNMRMRNSALTEFVFNLKRHSLLSYNTLPHLDNKDLADWITHA